MYLTTAKTLGDIGGQTRADFFKSLHESAKSASGELFADFLQTFFHEMQTFCRLFLRIIYSNADFLHTFSSEWIKLCRLFAHLFCICRLFGEHMHTFYREHASLLQTSCIPILDLMQTWCRSNWCIAENSQTLCTRCAGQISVIKRRRECPGRRSGGPGRRSGAPGRRSVGAGREIAGGAR